MRLLARTWNVFHGRTVPETRGCRLERMVRLVTADGPDLVALQEVPVWALGRLSGWSGMAVVAAVARHPLPVPLARAATAGAPGLLRSGLTGQANALLVAPAHAVVGAGTRRFGGREPRVAQIVRIETAAGPLSVGHAHLAHDDPRCAARQLAQLAELLSGHPGPALLIGDLNLAADLTDAFARLAQAGWSAPGPWIDHVLGRVLVPAHGPVAWPDERRRDGAVLLSDHRPVEAAMIRP